MIAHETGVTNVADPLGGSYFVEAMTDELEWQAEEIFAHLDEIGGGSILEGVYGAIEEGWFQSEIADSAYAYEKKLSSGRRTVVGVTGNFEGNDEDPPEILRIGPEIEELQLKRLAAVRAGRSPLRSRRHSTRCVQWRRPPTATSCRPSSWRCPPTRPWGRS